MAVVGLNLAQQLGAWGGVEQYRNPRNVQQAEYVGHLHGTMRDDGSVLPGQPRMRKPDVPFSVVVLKAATLFDLQVAVRQQILG